jgi:hypothetical protein
MEDYDTLDIKSETWDLSNEIARLNVIYLELSNYWLNKETKAKQRSKKEIEILFIFIFYQIKEEGKKNDINPWWTWGSSNKYF